MHNIRHWMRLVELTEAALPADFEHSSWGYWIEPDGKMKPVARHQHHAIYQIGWAAFASGRIRVTSISDASQVKTNSGLNVFAANFFTHFVTKRALRSLMALLSEYEFEIFTISGMSYKDEAVMMQHKNTSHMMADSSRGGRPSTRSEALASLYGQAYDLRCLKQRIGKSGTLSDGKRR